MPGSNGPRPIHELVHALPGHQANTMQFHDPFTNETMQSPERRVPAFKPFRVLKDAMATAYRNGTVQQLYANGRTHPPALGGCVLLRQNPAFLLLFQAFRAGNGVEWRTGQGQKRTIALCSGPLNQGAQPALSQSVG